MRYKQSKKYPDIIPRKKIYQNSKNWIVKTSLGFAGGLALLGMTQSITVRADDVSDETTPLSQSISEPSADDTNQTDASSSSDQVVTNNNSSTPNSTANNDSNSASNNISIDAKKLTDTVTGSSDESSNVGIDSNGNSTNDVDGANGTAPSATSEANTNTTDVQQTTTSAATEVPDSNTYGIDWNITDDGVLHIQGGTLEDTTYDSDTISNSTGPWTQSQKDKVTSISFDGDVTASNSIAGLFYNFNNLKNIENLNRLDTSNVTDMSGLFSQCSSLQSVDLSNFKTSKVTNITELFRNCSGLTTADLSSFKDATLKNMTGLFLGANKLGSVNVEGLDVSGVTSFHNVFAYCTSLQNLNISSWNMTKALILNHMFYTCSALSAITLPSEGISTKVSSDAICDFSNMFANCDGLVSLDISKINTAIKNATRVDMLSFSQGYSDSYNKLESLTLSTINDLTATGYKTIILGKKSDDRRANGWTDGDGTILGTDDLGSRYSSTVNGGNVTWMIDYADYVSFDVKYVAEDDPTNILYTTTIDKSDKYVVGDSFTPKSLSKFVDGKTNYKGYDATSVPAATNVPGNRVIIVKVPKALVYEPFTWQIVETDTNGKELKTTTIELPIRDNSATQIFNDGLLKLSDKKLVLYDEDNKNGTYIELPGSPAPFHITADLLEQIGLSDSITAGNLISMLGIVPDNGLIEKYYAGQTYIVHAVYEPEKDTNTNGGGGGSHNNSDQDDEDTTGTVDKINQTISIHPNSPAVQTYDNEGNPTEKIKLNPTSNWSSDAVMTLDGTKYYRVATNQWVKASDAYVYHAKDVNVRVYRDVLGRLKDSEIDAVNRALKSKSEWKSDRYVMFDDAQYYRVATNEFVNASDVYEYINVSGTLTTNSWTDLYDERGNKLTSHLNSGEVYAIDKMINIDGVDYYRVATNKFVRATDDIVIN